MNCWGICAAVHSISRANLTALAILFRNRNFESGTDFVHENSSSVWKKCMGVPCRAT